MKILYIQTFPLWGSGSGTYARYLAQEVGRHFKVALVAPDTRHVPNVTLYPLKTSKQVVFTGHPEWPNAILYTDITSHDLIEMYEEMLNSVRAARSANIA